CARVRQWNWNDYSSRTFDYW
nr:immunoglobulin heavy chain junction region [Macaca mulatta]MOV52283.1 immunoglobulin heavy chain junction region [Macaca mulatta]